MTKYNIIMKVGDKSERLEVVDGLDEANKALARYIEVTRWMPSVRLSAKKV